MSDIKLFSSDEFKPLDHMNIFWGSVFLRYYKPRDEKFDELNGFLYNFYDYEYMGLSTANQLVDIRYYYSDTIIKDSKKKLYYKRVLGIC